MTTAYLIEVEIDGKTQFVGVGGKIGVIPKFFNSAPRVKNILLTTGTAYGNWKYSGTVHRAKTKVIHIANIELGMQKSQATVYSVADFLARDFKSKVAIPANPKAVYMIKLDPEVAKANVVTTFDRRGEVTKSAPAMYSKASGSGPTPKFGRQWNRAGDLRNHLSGRLDRLNTIYKNAEVLEVEMKEDGITPHIVRHYPIITFYYASPSSRQRYKEHFGVEYQPTPTPKEI